MSGMRQDGEFWKTAIELQSSSGLGVSAFCRRELLSAATFYAWRRKLRGNLVSGEPAFVRLVPPTLPAQAVACFPDGTEIRVGVEILPALVAAIRQAPV